MARNLELKIEVDSFEHIIETLKQKGIFQSRLLVQKDTYYKWYKGLLKLRTVNGMYELIKYKRDEKNEDRWSDYFVINIEGYDPELFLSDIFETEVIVEKRRELILYKNTRIHLDEVDKLGNFIELETVVSNGDLVSAKREFNEVVTLLKLDLKKQIKKSYRNLLIEK
ncbi:MAG: class IV adenylate cyclase [Melioribacteraceae bacterium]|nr:class IV adenylate cyclase [Melioribacteraceae bacterium]